MDAPITQAKANLDRAAEVREELRKMDDAAKAENRNYTPAENARLEEAKRELVSLEERARTQLGLAERSEILVSGLGRFAGMFGTGTAGTSPALTPLVLGDDEIRSLHESFLSNRGSSVEVRAVSDYPSLPTYVPGSLPFRSEPTRIAELMPVQQVETSSVTYYATTAAADAADTVAVGATKPESTPGWTPTTEPAQKIAHFADVPTEGLADFKNFEAMVINEMLRGVRETENVQLLSGDGTGTNIEGLLNRSGILTYAPGSPEARLFSILHAGTLLRSGSAFIEPDTVVLNPSDWEKVRSTVATPGGMTITQPDVTTGAPATLWGWRVVITTALSAGTALVANFAEGTILFEREAARVSIDPYSQSSKNLVRFIAEERIALGVTRSAALCAVTFNGAG